MSVRSIMFFYVLLYISSLPWHQCSVGETLHHWSLTLSSNSVTVFSGVRWLCLWFWRAGQGRAGLVEVDVDTLIKNLRSERAGQQSTPMLPADLAQFSSMKPSHSHPSARKACWPYGSCTHTHCFLSCHTKCPPPTKCTHSI